MTGRIRSCLRPRRSTTLPQRDYSTYALECILMWDDADEQESVAAVVDTLEYVGPRLPFPYSSGVSGSRHARMRELRVPHRGKPFRIFYAFDPRRVGILLIGGSKAGDDRWYERMIPVADLLYDDHLAALEEV